MSRHRREVWSVPRFKTIAKRLVDTLLWLTVLVVFVAAHLVGLPSNIALLATIVVAWAVLSIFLVRRAIENSRAAKTQPEAEEASA